MNGLWTTGKSAMNIKKGCFGGNQMCWRTPLQYCKMPFSRCISGKFGCAKPTFKYSGYGARYGWEFAHYRKNDTFRKTKLGKCIATLSINGRYNRRLYPIIKFIPREKWSYKWKEVHKRRYIWQGSWDDVCTMIRGKRRLCGLLPRATETQTRWIIGQVFDC